MDQNVVLAEGNNSDSFGKIITLNDSAATLWKALVGKNFDADSAAEVLVGTYGIDRAQAIEDVSYILDKMTRKGLIEE